MDIGSDDVRAPDQDVSRLVDSFRVCTNRCSYRVAHAEHASSRADCSVEQRRAEPMEEAPVHAAPLEQAHRSCITVGKDGFRIFLYNRLQFSRNRIERLVPRYSFKFAVTLSADPLHGIEEST